MDREQQKSQPLTRFASLRPVRSGPRQNLRINIRRRGRHSSYNKPRARGADGRRRSQARANSPAPARFIWSARSGGAPAAPGERTRGVRWL